MRIEPEPVDLEPGQRIVGESAGDGGRPGDMGEIAHPPHQPSGDPRRAARAPRDLARAFGLSTPMPSSVRPARDDAFKFLDRIEIQPHRNAEAVAQGRGQQALPGGRADQGERRQVDPHRARRRPLADDQVERAVLHRRVEHFLDHRIEPVDLVDEQDVAFLQIGEQRGEIARLGDDRAGRGAKPDAELARDDLGQRGLAEPRRPEEQHMIHRLAAAIGRFR